MQKNHSLRPYNSFGLDARAALFASPESQEELSTVLEEYNGDGTEILVLGEGSNLLFTRDYPGLVIKPAMRGIYVLEESPDHVMVKVGAAENWDHFVEHALVQGWYGLENLSLIPGSVGAAPVQNIGAYGTELKDFARRIHAWDRHENKAVELCYKDCHFGYRDSIFKSSERGRYLITQVCFRLSKIPELKLDYGVIREVFEKNGGSTAMDLRSTVISIRRQKLPDHEEFGNAGSFFKNPVIARDLFERLEARHPGLPHYDDAGGGVKIPAAWLIQESGWKARREGQVGTWPSQPLVLVNYGGASGQEIFDFSRRIMDDVQSKFGIPLEREVNVV